MNAEPENKNNFWVKQVFKKISLQTTAGFTISGILLWLTFSKSGLMLQNIALPPRQWGWFILSVGAFVLSIWIQAVRARLYWPEQLAQFSPPNTYSSLLIGNFYNCILPGNMGDAIRSWHFAQKHKIAFTRSLAVITAEKWIDARLFILMVIVWVFVSGYPSGYITNTLVLTATITLFIAMLYYLMRKNRVAEQFILNKMLWFGKFPVRLYCSTVSHLNYLKKEGKVTTYLVYCLGIIILNNLQFYLLLKTVNIQDPICSIYTSFFVSISMMVIALIPAAPGNVGVLHYGLYTLLIMIAGQYNISATGVYLKQCALFGVYAHLSYFIPEIIMGAWYIFKERKLLFGFKA